MRLHRHVLPARLRPVVRFAGQMAVLLAIVTWLVWTLTVALGEYVVAEHRERFFREVRYAQPVEQGIEAACSVVHLLAPSRRQQLAELCGRTGVAALTQSAAGEGRAAGR